MLLDRDNFIDADYTAYRMSIGVGGYGIDNIGFRPLIYITL